MLRIGVYSGQSNMKWDNIPMSTISRSLMGFLWSYPELIIQRWRWFENKKEESKWSVVLLCIHTRIANWINLWPTVVYIQVTVSVIEGNVHCKTVVPQFFLFLNRFALCFYYFFVLFCFCFCFYFRFVSFCFVCLYDRC